MTFRHVDFIFLFLISFSGFRYFHFFDAGFHFFARFFSLFIDAICRFRCRWLILRRHADFAFLDIDAVPSIDWWGRVWCFISFDLPYLWCWCRLFSPVLFLFSLLISFRCGFFWWGSQHADISMFDDLRSLRLRRLRRCATDWLRGIRYDDFTADAFRLISALLFSAGLFLSSFQGRCRRYISLMPLIFRLHLLFSMLIRFFAGYFSFSVAHFHFFFFISHWLFLGWYFDVLLL